MSKGVSCSNKERFLKDFEFYCAFLPPVWHGEKRGKFQNPVEFAYKAVVLNERGLFAMGEEYLQRGY